jgi:hypothetical protein
MDEIGRSALKHRLRHVASMRAPLAFLLAVAILVGGYARLVWLVRPSTIGQDATSLSQDAVATLNANMPSEADRTAQESFPNRSAVPDEDVTAGEANNVEGKSLPTRRDRGLDASNSTLLASSPAQRAESDQSTAAGSLTDETRAIKPHDVPVGGCMPIGITARGKLVFPMECRELLEQHRGAYASLEPRSEPTPTPTSEQAVGVDRDLQTVDSVRDHDLQTVGSVDGQNAVNSPSKGSDVSPAPRAKVKQATDRLRTIGENGNGQRKVRQSSRAPNNRHQRERWSEELLDDPLAFNCMNCLLFGY